MESYNKQKWEDLDLTRDEIKNIGEALKKEEFRSLLLDYVKEINDPENRKLYEKEITQLENERGVDVKFIHPSPGYVIKTSSNGKTKTFINICSNSNIEKPSSTPSVDGEQKGLCWSLPHCISPPREDVDKKNNICTVFDVVFHPDTLHLTKSNHAFKKLVDETALDAIESNFQLSLDRINIKSPKMQFKGMQQATVIRKKRQNFQSNEEVLDIPNYPYPPLNEQQEADRSPTQNILKNHKKVADETKNVSYSTPKHTICYRNNIDLQNFTNDPMVKMSATVPNELVIVIDLPLLKRSTDATLDVLEKSLILISETPAKYKLKLELPYVVDSNKGNAKFDTDKKTLTVTLPVVKAKSMVVSKIDLNKDDSGIESDNLNNERNKISSGSSSDDDSEGKENKFTPSKNIAFNTQTFLKHNVHYSLPMFECLAPKDGILKITLFVPNVEPSSVEYITASIKKEELSGFHMSFLSTGNGFFTKNFAMCFVLPFRRELEDICCLLPFRRELEDDALTVEVWDNQVCIQAKLVEDDRISDSTFYVGIDESSLIKQEFSKCKFRDLTSAGLQAPELPEIQPNKVHFENQKFQEEKKHSNLIVSAESGSSFDDESSSSPPRQSGKLRTQSESHQGDTIRKRRGILKIGRSLSESSVDDYASWSSEKAEKSKKTVRFSDVISKQTFRMNSSILGQRKKNQRKMKNKKRAQERRLSESGNESEGESEIFQIKGKNSIKNQTDTWSEEAETSSCDISEVSEISDVSESDDGQQKDDSKTFLPCSSRKNHRRRGKKSARKQAATAKMQFLEN